jgi:arginyl-tRNA synthetase
MIDYLRTRITAALAAMGIDIPADEVQFEKPKSPEHGDIATNVALIQARLQQTNPRQLAQQLLAHLTVEDSHISSVEIAGPGFINFRFSSGRLTIALKDILNAGVNYGRAADHAGKSVNVEWVSANPTGPLHAGHGRQVCIGATVCSLLEWTGWNVTREYYFNNAGNQMNNLGLSIRERYRERLGEAVVEENVHYAGAYIQDIAQSIVEQHGGAWRDAPVDRFRKAGEDWCFAVIQRTLERLRVHHDVFFNEDTLYSSGAIDVTLQALRGLDLVYDHEGAVWLRASAFGAEKDRVVVKSTGEPTYRLPDIAYHCDKIQRGYDRVVDIFGADHIATIPDVLASVKALGLPTGHVDVLIHQMVSFVNEGEAMRMSKRAGNVYSLDDLISEVGADAVRYFFIMRSANAHLEFDIRLAQEQSENNPVYYLQYAHARIASIIRFAESENVVEAGTTDFSLLVHPSEAALIKSLVDFPGVIRRAAASYEVQQLCTYLHAVATAFHKFYHDCRVVTEDLPMTAARIALCKATRQVLANGFAIIGITAPERM